MNGPPSSSTPDSTWTRCEAYLGSCPDGTILEVSVEFGSSISTLLTVVSPLMLTSPELHYELFKEVRDIWLSAPDF
jgi:hypothetical protein